MSLPQTLVRVEAYEVYQNGVHPDDGSSYKIHHGYYSTMDKAIAAAKKIDGKYTQVEIFSDQYETFYKLVGEVVHLDLPDKGEVLKRLSAKERHVLGL